MNLRHLEYFLAVAEELHFGRAAERLHIASSPLSRQIQRFEQELGVELFQRNRRRVALTAAGQLLAEHGRGLLDEARRIEELMRLAGSGRSGLLSIGFIRAASYRLLPDVLRTFHDLYPDVQLELYEYQTRDQVEALRARRIDVGFMRARIDDPAIELVLLSSEPLLAAVPTSHPLAGSGRIDPAALAGDAFALLRRRAGPEYFDLVLSVCTAAGFSPDVVQEADDMRSVISFVSAGLCVALIPGMAAVDVPDETHVAYLELDVPSAPMVHLFLGYRRDDPSRLVSQFCDVAREASRETGRAAL